MSMFDSKASVANVSIGKPDWAKGNLPGVIKNIPVYLEQPFAEVELIKKETKPFKSEYNQKFLTLAKKAWKSPGSSYKSALDAGKEIAKLLQEENSELLLSLMLPEEDDSIDLIEGLIESQTAMNKMIVNARALAALKRSPASGQFDPSEVTLADVSKLHPDLKTQLSVFAQAEQYGATEKYIGEDQTFFFSGESDEKSEQSETDYAEAAKK